MFAADNPASPVAVYLVRRYFITTPTPNYKEADRLLKLLLQQQPKNGELHRMQSLVTSLAKTSVGAPLPAFQARSTKGEKVNQQATTRLLWPCLTCGAPPTCRAWKYNACSNKSFAKPKESCKW
ncbi:hypothetical protein [Hoylesella shahii]|uniref:hypothetical protein n=1 Tax=Hoylesella shahii TaxID=228603 RepID=UPI000AB25025|nr:hypothetical protein [Hoylesella shahii]